MLHLSAFADEIDPNIDEQIRVCRENSVTHVELRSVNKINVLDFTPELRKEIRDKLSDAGMGVVAIGSPIGKVALDKPWQEHLDRFKVAVDAAEFFGAKLIRVFSYYPPGGEGKGEIEPHRAEVIRRFQDKIAYLGNRSITLVHENEKGIYGDIGRRCVDIMTSVNSPKLRTAFDFANFVQCHEHPRDNWPGLKPYTVHIHVKDAVLAGGKVVPAGEGDGDIESILKDAYASGYRGFLSLEPHLMVAAHSHGETGPSLFKVATDALKKILERINIPIAPNA